MTIERSKSEVIFAITVLKRLGAGRVDSFEQRLRSQKLQYLAQAFSASTNYPFNLYVRGPYSPSLANDLFSLKDKTIEFNTDKFVPDELEARFQKLKMLVRELSSRDLELLATYHWLLRVAKFHKNGAEMKLADIKHATVDEIAKINDLITQMP